MQVKLLALFLLLSLVSVQAQRVVKIYANTRDETDAGMTLGAIDMEIWRPDFVTCKVYDIHHDAVNYQQGVTDVFEGSQLQACENFEVPNSEIGVLKVTHTGTDAWKPGYLALALDNSQWLYCVTSDPNLILDNDSGADFYCDTY